MADSARWAWLGLRGRERAGAGAGGSRPRSRPEGIGRFFFEFIFNAKTIPEKPRNCLKTRKILRKITKIPGKFLKIDYDMNNPNKAFGAHEKDFRAF
jgi:hypothetical protein